MTPPTTAPAVPPTDAAMISPVERGGFTSSVGDGVGSGYGVIFDFALLLVGEGVNTYDDENGDEGVNM